MCTIISNQSTNNGFVVQSQLTLKAIDIARIILAVYYGKGGKTVRFGELLFNALDDGWPIIENDDFTFNWVKSIDFRDCYFNKDFLQDTVESQINQHHLLIERERANQSAGNICAYHDDRRNALVTKAILILKEV